MLWFVTGGLTGPQREQGEAGEATAVVKMSELMCEHCSHSAQWTWTIHFKYGESTKSCSLYVKTKIIKLISGELTL